MKTLSPVYRLLLVVVLFIFSSACGLIEAATRPATATPAVQETDAIIPAESTPQETRPTETPLPSETPLPEILPTSGHTGFVLFDQEQKEFQVFDLQGQLISRNPAPGLETLSREQVDVVGQNIYYLSNIDRQVYLTNSTGVQALTNLVVPQISSFKISADEKMIAWAATNWDTTNSSSELWVGNLDGSGARKVASASMEQSPAFVFMLLEWTAGGKVLFDRTPVGYGGYILYGGHNSLSSYDPVSQQIVAYVAPEELHGLCLIGYRLDLEKVLFNCGSGSNQISILNLKDGSEKSIQAVPGYAVSGSAFYSPSGKWLVYATAESNPEHEKGQLLILPGDLSVSPVSIASVDNGYFVVRDWLDEDTLLVTRQEGFEKSIHFKMKPDGTIIKELAQGWFVEFTP